MSKRRRELGDSVPKDDWDEIINKAPKLTKWQDFKGDVKNLGLEAKEMYDSLSELDKMNIKASAEQIKNYAVDPTSENFNDVVDNAIDAIGLAGPEGKIASEVIKQGLPLLDKWFQGKTGSKDTTIGAAWKGIQNVFSGTPLVSEEWLTQDQINQNKWLDERIINPSLLNTIEFEDELNNAKKLIEERKKSLLGSLERAKAVSESVNIASNALTPHIETNTPTTTPLIEKPMTTTPAYEERPKTINPNYKPFQ